MSPPVKPEPPQKVGRERPTCAWLLSLVINLSALLIVSLLLRPGLSEPPEERDRHVGIVLASRDEPAEVDYFDGADAQNDSLNAAASAESSASAAAALSDALPSADAPAAQLLADIPLPALPTGPSGVQIGNVTTTPLPNRAFLPGVGEDEIRAAQEAFQASQRKSGPATRLSIFSSGEAVGNSFVFLIDRSRSMGGEGLGAIAAAEKELATALTQLGPQHRFQVIAYHQQPVYVSSRKLLEATPENKQAMQEFFSTLLAYGGTQHESALYSALSLEPDVIFLLTDGGDPYLNDRQIDNIVRHNDGRTAIHCIQFGFGPTPSGNGFMQKLASRNHGTYAYVDMSK